MSAITTLARRVSTVEAQIGDDGYCHCTSALIIRVWYPDDGDPLHLEPIFCDECQREKETVTLKVVYDAP